MKMIVVSLSCAALISMSTGTVSATSPRIGTAVNACKLMKVETSISLFQLQQIANARSLGLPDNASSKQIEDAAWKKYANMRAKQFSWPANLSKEELNKFEEKRKRIELCRSLNLTDTASESEIENASQKLAEQQRSMQAEYREILQGKLSPSQQLDANKKVLEKEKELRRAGCARVEGLSPSATWAEIDTAQRKNSQAMAARKLGISSSSSLETIMSTREKQLQETKIAMGRKILKATPKVTDTEVLSTIQKLAKHFGYPKIGDYHHEFDVVTTADDLFALAGRSIAQAGSVGAVK